MRRWGLERGKGRGLLGLSELNEMDDDEVEENKKDDEVVVVFEGEGRESGIMRSRVSELGD